MADLEELAVRCEAASGADRMLDAEIHVALYGFPQRPYNLAMGCRPKGSADLDRMTWLSTWGVSAFTRSLDAALTLVPEGWKLRQINFSGPCADDRKWHLNLHGGSEGQDCFTGRGDATPALALCAAALRARKQMGETERG